VIRPLVSIFDFDAAGTELVVWTARAYLLGLTGHTLLEVAARSFYAQQDAKTPLWASAFMATLFIILARTFSRSMGAAGIGLANSIAFTSQAVLLWVLLSQQFRGLLRVGRTSARVVGGTILGGSAAYLTISGLLLPGISVLELSLLSSIALAIGALAIGALAVIPFIWPEVKMLVKL
jgi:putative peptidoglycan lipid II flippase